MKNPTVFLGPIAESCHDALDTFDYRMNIAIENYSSISNYFDEISDAYKKKDKKASNKIIMLNDTGKIEIKDGTDEFVSKMIEMAESIAKDNSFGYGRGGYGEGNAFDCGGLICYIMNKVL